MEFQESACHISHWEAALRLDSAMGTCAVIYMYHRNPYAAIRTKAPYGYQAKLFQFHVFVRVCVRAHIRVLLPVFVPVLVPVLFCICVRVDLNTAL
jgi:hypothetical protein